MHMTSLLMMYEVSLRWQITEVVDWKLEEDVWAWETVTDTPTLEEMGKFKCL